jgi:hypothetical protein
MENVSNDRITGGELIAKAQNFTILLIERLLRLSFLKE